MVKPITSLRTQGAAPGDLGASRHSHDGAERLGRRLLPAEILATRPLVRMRAEPVHRIIGDLSESDIAGFELIGALEDHGRLRAMVEMTPA